MSADVLCRLSQSRKYTMVSLNERPCHCELHLFLSTPCATLYSLTINSSNDHSCPHGNKGTQQCPL